MNLLDEIVRRKIEEVKRSKENLPLKELRNLVERIDFERRNFSSSLLNSNGKISIIAELKKRSPVKGIFVDDWDICQLARKYESDGARAISVLTDSYFFGGRKQYISQVKSVVRIPILRKDFIIDEYQIYETKYLGADAFLLIVRIVDDVQLEDYLALAGELGLEVLVEVYDKHDIARALKVSPYPKIIGINNRNLEDFSVKFENSIELREFLPRDVISVSESGIESVEDVEKLKVAGFHAVLIGEAFMRNLEKVKEFTGAS